MTYPPASINASNLPALLGQRIRAVRQQSGRTQGELAAALSARLGAPISRSTLGNYETGRRPMPAELLLLIADVCETSLESFALHDAPAPDAVALSAHSTPTATGTAALALITQALLARPDVIPFVLEMISSFVEEAPGA